VSVQFYVYELRDDEQDVPRRLSWDGWQELSDWLQEEGLDAEGRMARHVEIQQVRQAVEETAGVEEASEEVFVAPLPDVRGGVLMFGLATEDADYVVSPVELPWLLVQSVSGWEASLTFSVERIGGRGADGYFDEEAK